MQRYLLFLLLLFSQCGEAGTQSQGKANPETGVQERVGEQEQIGEQENAAETIVYITKTGKKYHREGCHWLNKSKIKVSLSDALENGYEACKTCKP